MCRSIQRPKGNPFRVYLTGVLNGFPPPVCFKDILIVIIPDPSLIMELMDFPCPVLYINPLAGSEIEVTSSLAIGGYGSARENFDFVEVNYRFTDFTVKNLVVVLTDLLIQLVQHVDFYDSRSKAIIKNRVVLDKLFADHEIESLIEASSSNPSNETSISSGFVPLPGPIGGDNCEQCSPEKRVLRSTTASASATNKPERYRVQLLLTVPHIVSQH